MPIKIMLKTKVLEINDREIIILQEGGERKLEIPDTVIIAMGARPNPLPLPKMEIPTIGYPA